MAIDLSTPTIAPPRALDVLGGGTEAQNFVSTTGSSGQGQGLSVRPNAPAPQALPQANQAQRGDSYGAQSSANQLGERLGGSGGALENFARNSLSSSSRFDIPLVQQGLDLINSDIEKQGRDARAGLDEFHSSRGLVGSSVEAWNQKELAADLERERMRRDFDLSMAMANTNASDRQAAANIGLGVGGFQAGLGRDQLGEGRYAAEFNRQLGRDYEQDYMNRLGFGLNTANQAFGQNLAASQFGEGQFQTDINRYFDAWNQSENRGLQAGLANQQNELARQDIMLRAIAAMAGSDQMMEDPTTGEMVPWAPNNIELDALSGGTPWSSFLSGVGAPGWTQTGSAYDLSQPGSFTRPAGQQPSAGGGDGGDQGDDGREPKEEPKGPGWEFTPDAPITRTDPSGYNPTFDVRQASGGLNPNNLSQAFAEYLGIAPTPVGEASGWGAWTPQERSLFDAQNADDLMQILQALGYSR